MIKNIIELVNEFIQPEHLEINCKNHRKYSKSIINAGSIMCGEKFSNGTYRYGCGGDEPYPSYAQELLDIALD